MLKGKVFSAWVVVILTACLCSGLWAAYEPGSKIEVREGDTWSQVTVVRTEGRRVYVRYDDGTEEWVGPDRIRGGATGNSQVPAPDDTLPPNTDNTAATPPSDIPRQWVVGEAVEIKRDGDWHAAHIRQINYPWFFVCEDEDEHQHQNHWTEGWTLRVPGSAYDVDGNGASQWTAEIGQVAPRNRPTPAPASFGDPFRVVPDAQKPASKSSLTNKFEHASFDNSQAPVTGGNLSLSIPAARTYTDFAGWSLRGAEDTMDRILPCGGSSSIAVAAYPGQWGRWTRLIRTNLRTHSQLDKRLINVSDLKVFSAADDGNLLMSVFDWDKDLQLWRYSNQHYDLVWNLRLSNDEHVESAAFIGDDKAVVAESDGQVYLLDVARKQVLSSIKKARESTVFVHPSQQAVGVVTSSCSAVILRASDFAVIAEFDDAGTSSNVAIDPSGQFAAYVSNTGSVRVVKIADGSQLGIVSVGAAFNGRLDLVDGQYLLVDHSICYDVKSGLPIWIYRIPDNGRVEFLPNGQFLIATRTDFWGKEIFLAQVTLPDQTGKKALKSATPDRFILLPGTSVKLDADFGAFGADRDKASQIVRDAAARAGLKLTDSDAPFRLTVKIASGPSEKRDYVPGMFPFPMARPFSKITTVDVPSNILTASLNFKGDDVWSQQITFTAGGSLQHDANQSLQEAVNDAAKPSADALKSLNFPSYLPIGAKPGTPAALGASDLSERSFVPERPGVAGRGN